LSCAPTFAATYGNAGRATTAKRRSRLLPMKQIYNKNGVLTLENPTQSRRYNSYKRRYRAGNGNDNKNDDKNNEKKNLLF